MLAGRPTHRGQGMVLKEAEPVTLPYAVGSGYDEMLASDGTPRPLAKAAWSDLSALGPDELSARQHAAERVLLGVGVTFQVGEAGSSIDRTWPFDVIPRIVPHPEWVVVEQGITQRHRALDRFLDDVYHEQRAVREGVVPAELVMGSPNFRPECMGVDPPGRTWAHICGSDLVRDGDGTFFVLEDNLRVPSGVSYLLENRMISKRVLPELFRSSSIEPVDPYIGRLGAMLASVSPRSGPPTVVVLTPGAHNAAYFEHAFLAQQLGVELVEGGDLVVDDDDTVSMRTVGGLERVDVIYRRIDDLFLDPEVFRRDSLIGVAGLMRAWRSGRVAIVNAPGSGVADDKAVYPYVPELVRFFLGEEPILPTVPTWGCSDDEGRRFVLDNLGSLVVKPSNESGGYGVVIGPHAGREALARVASRIERHPRGWVAQPVLALSTAPTLCDGQVVPRHVDLRPFSLLGPDGSYVTRGGLTRVALQEDSLIVNSSQGGGSKDTWVVRETIASEPPWLAGSPPQGVTPSRDVPTPAVPTAGPRAVHHEQ